MATAELPRDDLVKMVRTLSSRIAAIEQRSPFAGTGISLTDPDGVPRLTLTDSGGGLLLAEDPTGSGAAWPLAPVPVPGTTWQTWDYTTAATFTTIAEGGTVKSSPALTVTVVAIADGSAAGEVRVMVGGVQVGATAAFPNASLTRFTVGPQLIAGVVGDPVTLSLQARVTTGTGRCLARVVTATQSPAP